MATYLLLRNNKNSGPYTLESLTDLGLKPYDLVWVEGKSAAWRYPSEVEELKHLAPVIEEQPYDRFYKKPLATSSQPEKSKTESVEVKPQEKSYFVAEDVKQSVKSADNRNPKKQVFVSLPANSGNTIVRKPETVSSATANEQLKTDSLAIKKNDLTNSPSYTELVHDYNSSQPADKQLASANASIGLNQASPIETKYAQSLDDIKDIYARNLADRKRKNAQRKMLMTGLKRGLPFAAVLIIGFISGGLLMNRKPGKDNAGNTSLAHQDNSGGQANVDKLVIRKVETTPSTALTPAAQDPVPSRQEPSNRTVGSLENNSPNKIDLSGQNPGTSDRNRTSLPLNVAKKFVAKQTEAANPNNGSQSTTQQTTLIEPDPVTGSRNKIVRSEHQTASGELPTGNNSPKGNLMKQVNIKGNDYKVGTFGGIHDLQLTVVNNSNYLLDRVLVELQYLKPSDQPLKTDNIQFENIAPNGSMTLAIPPTNRGIKVVYKVINVQSKAAGNETAGL